MRLSTRATFRASLVWAMGLLAVVYVAGLVLPDVGWGPAVERWFSTIVNGTVRAEVARGFA